MSFTTDLCERIAATGFGQLDDKAAASARRLVLDGLAITVAGVEEDTIRILAAHHRDQGGAPQATAIGLGFRLNTVAAAALNGASMHVLDFEPMWSPANHALSTTLPAVLALAEHRGAAGREVIAALVKGTEIQGWIRQASGQFEPRRLKFHPPGVVGPIGASVAAGHLLGLDPGQLSHAIGIAASRSGTLLSNVGTSTKSTHCGHAAALGLESALLAQRGFTGNTDTFTVAQGFADAFFPETFRRDDLQNFGPPFRLVEPGYAIKMFPSQFGTHFGITAGLELHPQIPPGAGIAKVRLTAPVMPYVDRAVPPSGLSGKFSLQYTLACALLDGRVGIASFSDERLAAADMQALLAKIELVPDPSIPASFETMHVDLHVTLEDGTTFEARCDGPRGIFGSPPISDEEHLGKVRDCLAVGLDRDRADRVVALARSLDRQGEAGVREMIELSGCYP